jgi:hypothetical protein
MEIAIFGSRDQNMQGMLIRPFMERVLSCLKFVVFSLAVTLLSLSCQKDEGKGGSGSISGTLTEQFYNDDYSLLIHEKPAVDEDVYIVYGDKEELGDRVRTNHLGQFLFKYLYPGSYQVYFLSGDSIADMDMEKIYELELDRGEDLEMGSLEKLSTMDFDDGSAVIKGVVKEIDYVDGSTVIEKSYYVTEQEVYLSYNNHIYYDERIRTQEGGVFAFGGLIPGDYKVFLYSDDMTGTAQKVTLNFPVNIKDMDEVFDLGEIVIEKL